MDKPSNQDLALYYGLKKDVFVEVLGILKEKHTLDQAVKEVQALSESFKELESAFKDVSGGIIPNTTQTSLERR